MVIDTATAMSTASATARHVLEQIALVTPPDCLVASAMPAHRFDSPASCRTRWIVRHHYVDALRRGRAVEIVRGGHACAEALVAASRAARQLGLASVFVADSTRRITERLRDAALAETPDPYAGDGHIRRRIALALINEAARVLEEGVAARASDIDVIACAGELFPPDLGGPLFHGETLRWTRVHRMLCARARRFGPRWTPAASIEQLARGQIGTLYPETQ